MSYQQRGVLIVVLSILLIWGMAFSEAKSNKQKNMKITGSEPAGACNIEVNGKNCLGSTIKESKVMPGLTIRQYFAMSQMQALATSVCSDAEGDASEAVKRADALIAELNKDFNP